MTKAVAANDEGSGPGNFPDHGRRNDVCSALLRAALYCWEFDGDAELIRRCVQRHDVFQDDYRQLLVDIRRHVDEPSATLVNTDEVCEFLDVSKPTVYLLLEEGLPCVVISAGLKRAHRRFDLKRVFEWLESREQSGRGRDKPQPAGNGGAA